MNGPGALPPSRPTEPAELLPQSVLDAVPFGAFITDKQLNLIQVNKWICSHVKKTPASILFQPIQIVFPEIPDRRLIEAYKMVIQNQSAITLSYRIHRHLIKMPATIKGEMETMPQTATIVPISDGRHVVGTLTYVMDISDRVISEQSLQQEVNKLHHLHEIDRALATLELGQCLQSIVSHSHHLFHARSTALFFMEDPGLRLVASHDEGDAFQTENSCAERVVQGKKSILVKNPAPGTSSAEPEPSVCVEMAAPLMIYEECIGVLAVQSGNRNIYHADDLAMLDTLASRAAVAIHNARLHDAERTQRQLSEALYQVSLILTSQRDPQAVINGLLENMEKVIPYDSASLILMEGSSFHVAQHRGSELFQAPGDIEDITVNQPILETIESMIQTRRPFVIPDTRGDPRYRMTSPLDPTCSWISAPIIIREEVIGFLSLRNSRVGFYTQDKSLHLASFAALAGVALENSRLHAEQERLASTDGLTGVANRRRFDEVLAYEFSRSVRFERPAALIMIDLDNFKHYNDTFGHPVGDNLLRNMAKCLRVQLRNTDTFARYGGEEFAVILPETDLDEASNVASRLCSQMASLHLNPPLADAPIPDKGMTISLGVAVVTPLTSNPRKLITDADAALYKAKNSGKNRYVVMSLDDGTSFS